MATFVATRREIGAILPGCYHRRNFLNRVQMAESEVKTVSLGYPMPGDVLDERYRLDEIINAGGMGVIMRARQLAMDRDVAVKLLLPDRSQRETTRTRFMREIHLAKQLTHPNTIRLYDYGKHGDFLYLVMELLAGQDLKAVLREDGPLPVSRALDILIQATDAVSEAHERNIVHRDLKPGNLFIQRLGSNRDFVKVLDFGIAKSLDSQKFDVTSTGEVSGTVAYLSPEMVRGQRPDKRADVYALAVLFMEMVTGRKIFEGTTVAETLMNQMQKPPTMPPSLRNTALAGVLERALAKDPDRRQQDACELLAALNSVVSSVSPTLVVSAAEIDDTYGPRASDEGLNSEESLGEPSSDPGEGSSARQTRIGYAMAIDEVQTTIVRTDEEIGDAVAASAESDRSRLGLLLGGIAVLIVGGVLGAVLRSPNPPPPPVEPPPKPVVAVVAQEPDVGVEATVVDLGTTTAEEPESPILPARDTVGVALDLASGAAQMDAEDRVEAPRKSVQRPPKPRDKRPPADPVDDLDVFGAAEVKPEVKPATLTPAELRAAANVAFLAGDYAGCISKCKEALAGGETGCNALLANAYRQSGNAEVACRYYKAAGIAHKSCMTLQSR